MNKSSVQVKSLVKGTSWKKKKYRDKMLFINFFNLLFEKPKHHEKKL